MPQQYWPNQWIFILAAIGSAAGLGNLWRFPFLVYEYGGAAFVIAIVVANIVIGIPLLLLEVALGQMSRHGAPDAFGSIKKSFRYVGWIALFFGFLILTYYMVVVGWGINYFVDSFSLAWGNDTSGYFFNEVLQISDGPGTIGGVSLSVFLGLIVAYALVYFSAWKGVQSISKVVVWTATIPFVILALLIVRAVTLPGAELGLSLYLFPVWSELLNPQLWLAAFSQVFFSLSIGVGIMIAYGSLKKENSDIAGSTIWIALGNFAVSIMSGFVVFGTLGYMALSQGVPVQEVVSGGPSLAFVVFPAAINLLPALNEVVAVLFFGAFLLLAVDSAFSLFEGIATAFRDRFPTQAIKKISLLVALFTFLGSLPFATHAGLYFLDIVDHFVINYGVVIVGILQAIIVGWLWKGNSLLNYVNERSNFKIGTAWQFAIKYAVPLFLVVLLAINIVNEFRTPYEGYPVWALLYLGIIPIVLSPLLATIVETLTKTEADQIEE